MRRRHFIAGLAGLGAAGLGAPGGAGPGGRFPRLRAETVLDIEATPDNPRNSEGDFLALEDGRLLFVYSHYTDTHKDHGHAWLAFRESADGGSSWSAEGHFWPDMDANVKTPSFVRLDGGEIGCFFLYDYRQAGGDDSGVMVFPAARFSSDPGRTWSDPVISAHDELYLGNNNDRVVRLSSGRVLMPLTAPGGSACYYSDDNGRSFTRSASVLGLQGPRPTCQEPGVVELRDGRVMMFMRTKRRRQYFSFSGDLGETWSSPARGNIVSPLSPASIERIPSTGDLLLVYNHNGRPWLGWELLDRAPLNVAISSDEGQSWRAIKKIYDDMSLWYCYTAIEFVEHGGQEYVLLGHTAGSGFSSKRLADLRITRFPVRRLYE